MNRSTVNKDSIRHIRQISLGDSVQKSIPSEILTLTHYQFESLHSDSFAANMSCINSSHERIKSGRKPKIKPLSIKLSGLSKVLPVLNYGNLPLQKVINRQKAPKDFIITEPKEPIVNNNSSSQRVFLSEHDTSEVLPSSTSNLSRFHILPSPKIQEESGYVLQNDYIENNPHFSRYNKSVNKLDKLEASKVILAKDLLSLPETSKGFLKKMLTSKKDDLLLPLTKIVKENNMEIVELTKDKTLQFKVSASGREFPLTMEIKANSGTFEVFVSKSKSAPAHGNCDYYYTQNGNFQIEYNAAENIKYVYFRIVALEKLYATINVTFATPKKLDRRSISTLSLKSPKERSLDTKKKQVYEFFHENMQEGEVEKMREMAKQIRKEKKAKSLSMAGNQNLPQKNIETAHDYNEIKQSKLISMVQKQAVLSCTNRINKERKDIEHNGQMLYNVLKPHLKKLEEDWKASQIKKKKDRANFVETWFKALALLPVLECVAKTKARIKEEKARRELLENSAIKIQKEIQAYLERPVIVRYEDENKNKSFKQESDIQSKILASIYQATNAVALITYKRKKFKALRTIGRMFRDMHSLDPIREALDIWIDKVIKIQHAWRRNREIFNARVQVFFICWRKYCRVLVKEEQKSRKKDNTETIAKITDDHVVKYAKTFVSERMKAYREALAACDRVIENKSLFVHTEILEGMEAQNKAGSQLSLRPSLTKSIQFVEPPIKKKDNPSMVDNRKSLSRKGSKTPNELDSLLLASQVMQVSQVTVAKPRLRVQPTRAEMKQIFLKIKKELKT